MAFTMAYAHVVAATLFSVVQLLMISGLYVVVVDTAPLIEVSSFFSQYFLIQKISFAIFNLATNKTLIPYLRRFPLRYVAFQVGRFFVKS
ncbi:unnamed protein product [Haemonchus placei]|uniref:Serpentine receptor class gamma n=1 Tax=Haemonchus placei TaxID=6290 RepID=A0A0N4VTD1_HAEPC|nr:unnamed protein product [Haemonchus placei]